MPKLTTLLCIALCALLVTALPAQARKSLHGSKGGYSLVVPGNEVLSGKVTLRITAYRARHNRLVPWKISCKAGKTPWTHMVTMAALANGVRTLYGRAQSDGLVPGDHCKIYRRSKLIHRVTLR